MAVNAGHIEANAMIAKEDLDAGRSKTSISAARRPDLADMIWKDLLIAIC